MAHSLFAQFFFFYFVPQFAWMPPNFCAIVCRTSVSVCVWLGHLFSFSCFFFFCFFWRSILLPLPPPMDVTQCALCLTKLYVISVCQTKWNRKYEFYSIRLTLRRWCEKMIFDKNSNAWKEVRWQQQQQQKGTTWFVNLISCKIRGKAGGVREGRQITKGTQREWQFQ